MILKENRLKGEKQFGWVFRKGKTYQGEGFTIRVLPSRPRHGGVSRIGIIVSAKFSKKATERNRAKRVVRAGARDILPLLKQSLDLVVVPLKELTPEEVKKGLLQCLSPWL